MAKHITDNRSPRSTSALAAYVRIARRMAKRPHKNVLFRKGTFAGRGAAMVPQYVRIERGRLVG